MFSRTKISAIKVLTCALVAFFVVNALAFIQFLFQLYDGADRFNIGWPFRFFYLNFMSKGERIHGFSLHHFILDFALTFPLIVLIAFISNRVFSAAFKRKH